MTFSLSLSYVQLYNRVYYTVRLQPCFSGRLHQLQLKMLILKFLSPRGLPSHGGHIIQQQVSPDWDTPTGETPAAGAVPQQVTF